MYYRNAHPPFIHFILLGRTTKDHRALRGVNFCHDIRINWLAAGGGGSLSDRGVNLSYDWMIVFQTLIHWMTDEWISLDPFKFYQFSKFLFLERQRTKFWLWPKDSPIQISIGCTTEETSFSCNWMIHWLREEWISAVTNDSPIQILFVSERLTCSLDNISDCIYFYYLLSVEMMNIWHFWCFITTESLSVLYVILGNILTRSTCVFKTY